MQDQDTVRIPLYARDDSIRAYTLVDAADAPLVASERWLFKADGYAYRYIRVDGKQARLQMHRVLLGLPIHRDGREPDHINRNGLDNRRTNLRIVTRAGNMQNRSSYRGSTSQYRGVYWDSRKQRWRAQIVVNGKRMKLGSFTDEQEASEVAKAARLRLMPFAVD
jgi:hypothetical protein